MKYTLYALNIKENLYLRLLPDPTYNLERDSSSGVLKGDFYLIAGRLMRPLSCTYVEVFDPVEHKWTETNFTMVRRERAYAAFNDDYICLF